MTPRREDGVNKLIALNVRWAMETLGGKGRGLAQEVDPQKVMEALEALSAAYVQRLPDYEKRAWEWVDYVFAPNVVMRQMLIALGLEVGLFSFLVLQRLTWRLVNRLTKKGKLIAETKMKMVKAKNYYEWLKCAERMDELEGNNKWREIPQSHLYDYRMLQEKINQMNNMMANGDVFQLMFFLRGGISRNQFGLLHEQLYTRAYSGTKKIVERYLETVVKALNFVCDAPADKDKIGADTKLAFFNETRHAYGRTALLLSGGAGLGFYHVGFVKALFEQGILPRVLSGASAGSIISSMIGVRTDDELLSMFTDGKIKLDFFKLVQRRRGGLRGNSSSSSNGSGSSSSLSSSSDKSSEKLTFFKVVRELLLEMLWYGDGVYIMDTEHFRKRLKGNIGNYTFQEAFDRTGRILNIIVAPVNGNDPPRLLNYLTSPHVLVWSAAAVSSAAPGVFEPGYLYVRQADGSERPESSLKWYDGSVEKDLPMEQLAELFNINHFLVSQVNPQAHLFSSLSLPAYIWNSTGTALVASLMQFFKSQFRSWCRNLFKLLGASRKSGPWSMRGVGLMFTQDYEGRDIDITIMPWAGHIGFFGVCSRILSNPDFNEYLEMLAYGERKSWPLLHAARSHCITEMSLEKCVQRLRKAVAHESAMKASHSHQVVKGLGERGRAPSFYTVPSLVNLSGLSVTDPVIHHSGSGSGSGGPSTVRIQLPASPTSQPPRSERSDSNADLEDDQPNFIDSETEDEGGQGRPPSDKPAKSTNMALFYYKQRRSKSCTSLAKGQQSPSTTTEDAAVTEQRAA